MDALKYYFKGCNKCGGDLVYDDGDWRCWQCGQYYSPKSETPTDRPRFESLAESVQQPLNDSDNNHQANESNGQDGVKKQQRRGYGARIARNIDSVIRAKKVSDERWWARNSQVIAHLDQGQSIREIAQLMGRGERQIRVIRERLIDLRAANEEEPSKRE